MLRTLRLGVALLVALAVSPTAFGQVTFTADTVSGAPGDSVSVTVTIDTDTTLRAFSFGLSHDAAVVALDSVVAGTALTDTNGGAGPDYLQVVANPGGDAGGYVATVIDFELVETLPALDGQVVATFNYTIDGALTEDASSALTFNDLLGTPAVETLYVADVEGELPTLVSGSVDAMINVGTLFLRGDADGNGVVFPILDALYILEFGFTSGPAPPCNDAADADDNGVVFPILDALYILEFGFTSGPAPLDPGPDVCGVDPTDDDGVDCLNASVGCL